MDAHSLPNLLILSQEIPQSIGAGSILLQRLFQKYPAEKLLVLGPAADRRAEVLDCRYEFLQPFSERLNRTRLSKLARSLRAYKLLPTSTTSSIKRLLKGFKPDLVMTVMQEQSYYYLAHRFAEKEKLPLLLYIHDLPELFDVVYQWAEQKQLQRNAEIYRYASRSLCISRQMKDHLTSAYRANCEVLYPLPSENLKPRPLAESRRLKQPGVLTVGYVGTMTYGRGAQLNNMIPTFKKAGARLRIYSADPPFAWSAADVVTHCGYAPPDETWSRIKNDCDAVILPYIWSEDSKYQSLYRTSFPSKLPEYLALGMPVLMVGPEYVAGIEWGLENPNTVMTVTDNDPEAWTKALKDLKQSESLRAAMSERVVAAGERDFSPNTITNNLMKHLRDVGFGANGNGKVSQHKLDD
jgi:glycosyltransferase involved in cell wall biosynthesis